MILMYPMQYTPALYTSTCSKEPPPDYAIRRRQGFGVTGGFVGQDPLKKATSPPHYAPYHDGHDTVLLTDQFKSRLPLD